MTLPDDLDAYLERQIFAGPHFLNHITQALNPLMPSNGVILKWGALLVANRVLIGVDKMEIIMRHRALRQISGSADGVLRTAPMSLKRQCAVRLLATPQ